MCGIAGFSLNPDSSVDRTLAAQALLAGISERGADAVGYAQRSSDGPVSVTKLRGGASALLACHPREAAVRAPTSSDGDTEIEAQSRAVSRRVRGNTT